MEGLGRCWLSHCHLCCHLCLECGAQHGPCTLMLVMRIHIVPHSRTPPPWVASGGLAPPRVTAPTTYHAGQAASLRAAASSPLPAIRALSLSAGSLSHLLFSSPGYPYSNLFQMLGNSHSPAQHENYFPGAYQPLERLAFSSLPASLQQLSWKRVGL